MDNKQLKVLVIEGNSKIAEDLKKELISEGNKVTVSGSTEQGLLRAKAYHFDLFVVNCGNDGKQGFNFATTICNEEEYQNTKFLFTFSPKVNVDVRLRKFEHRFDIIKLPLDVTELKIRLPQLLAEQSQKIQDTKAEKPRPTDNQSESTKNKKVLLVEDNPLNQKVLGMFISKLGFEHDVASNGQMAVDLSNATNYTFILMDIYMPGMDGTEATELIRAKENNGSHRAKIIAITANESEESVKRCYDSGMDDYLVKPFTIEKLKDKLV